MSKEAERAPGNGKDQDTQIVDGNITPKSTLVGLRVTKSTVSETSDGGARAVITVAGTKLIAQKLAGEQVNVTTSGGRGGFGKCVEVTTKAGKEEGKKTYRMKVEGARDLDALVGLQVTVDQTQMYLPIAGAEDRPKKRARGKDVGAGA